VTRDQRGAVTAELALGIPLLLSLTWGLVWLLSVGEMQVRVVDAAREAARAAARGEAPAACVARGEQVAPGSTVVVTASGGEAVSTATAAVDPPGGLLGFLPPVSLRAQAVSATEGGP
jgi:Flp pilus assembly protein TadG